MHIYVDADACPVIDEVIEVSKGFNVDLTIVCDDSHVINKPGINIIIVEKGNDSSDYKILSLINSNDIVITNDYGLSALVLAKNSIVFNFDGKQVSEFAIDAMLESRAFSAKMRKNNVRLKGPSKRNMEQNKVFKDSLSKYLQKTLQ